MQNFFVKNKSIVTFLILEVVALTAFNFGNVSHIFGIAGGVLAVISVVFLLGIEKDKKSLLPFLVPVGLILIVSLWGSLNNFSKSFTVTSNIALAISLPSFLILGFALRKFSDVKTKTVLLVVGGALAMITLFGLFSTIVEYGFFYRLIHKAKPNYYYNGLPYDVTKEMYWLSGFKFGEVYTQYGSLFAVLTASFLPGLLFISPKEERNDFIICASIGAVGLLTLLFLPDFKAIAVLAVASLFAFVYKFLREKKRAMKTIGFSFLGVLALLVLFFIVALINAATSYKLPGFLNRLFASNRIMTKVTPVFDALFTKVGGKLINFFGLNPTMSNELVTWQESNMFEVQLLKEVGLIGALLFGLFLVLMGYILYLYLKKSEDSDASKNIFVVLILSFFIYESLFNVISIAPHEENYTAFLRSPLLMVILFVFGYLFTSPCLKKEETQNE